MKNKIKKGTKLQDMHSQRTNRKISVQKVSKETCTVENARTGRVTSVSTQRLANSSRFKVVA